MDRRHFLRGIGVGVVGLSFPFAASPAWSELMSGTEKISWFSGARRRVRSCKIIGIGHTGCNFVMASRSDAVLECAGLMPEFICIDLGLDTLEYVDAANGVLHDSTPIKTLSLAPLGAGGFVNYARVAALRNRDALTAMLAGADMVFLVAGLGGGTGSGVTPIMARLAREAGALTVAVVVTPFEYEERRHRKADTAIRYLNREANLVVRFSNQGLAKTLGDDITINDFFTMQNQRIAVSIRGLMNRASQLKC